MAPSTTTVFKPTGLATYPPHQLPEGDCVLRRLLAQQPWRAAVNWPQGFEGGIAHRLDIPTSGALLVADDLDSLDQVRRAFKHRALRKRYLFLTDRSPQWSVNRCDRALAHAKGRKGTMVVQRGPNTPHRGRWLPAETTFERVEGPLWSATMRTGVMHQIRAHAAFVGLPLRGDRRYGGGGEGAFWLHHEGLRGPDVRTSPVSAPTWVSSMQGS
jgi:23S rRNA pseudouridine1911/1915/1917 synthase